MRRDGRITICNMRAGTTTAGDEKTERKRRRDTQSGQEIQRERVRDRVGGGNSDRKSPKRKHTRKAWVREDQRGQNGKARESERERETEWKQT